MRAGFDLEQYEKKANAPSSGKPISIAVIGAGISGLTAAGVLSDHGHRVTVFEESNEPGGRLGTFEEPFDRADAGAQYFTVRDARLRRHVESWVQEGIVSRWQGVLGAVDAPGELRRLKTAIDRYVGTPSMKQLADHLSADLTVRYRCQVLRIEQRHEKWGLIFEDGGPEAVFDAVIIATPAEQAVSLLPADSELVPAAAAVRMRPCWAVAAAFAAPLDLPFDGLFFNNAPLTWAARNNSKPGRSSPETWIFHAAHEWSTQINRADNVARRLLESFFHYTRAVPARPVKLKTRIWPFAAASTPLDSGCLWSETERVGICGDWCHMSRIEGAFLSGTAIAGRLLGSAHRLITARQTPTNG